MTEREAVKEEFADLLHRLRALPDVGRARLQSRFAHALLKETFEVATPRGPLAFVLLGQGTAIRAASLLTKQPDTIAWIDSFRPGCVFWDVGANVGAFTLYAALRGDTRVVALEPAAVNYFLLSANCEANRMDAVVECLLVGLARESAIGRLVVSQFSPAESFSFRERPDDKPYGRQAAVLLSMDHLVEQFGLPCPNYIKIDVPGLTADIIAGGMATLRRPDVRELHIEMREHSKAGQQIAGTLAGLGFTIAARPVHGETTDLTFVRSDA